METVEPIAARDSINHTDKSEIQSAKRDVSFAEAFRFWLKLGFISFGGPAGQIAICTANWLSVGVGLWSLDSRLSRR